jgi:hypothetical protein
MTDAIDIRPPGDVDAAWLTALLAANGIDARLAGFQAKAIGTGQIGDSVRFRLDYAAAAPGAPASLVGKFPSADPDSFRTGVMLGNYARDVHFYRQLAGAARIATPRCYAAELREETGEFVLMMEDLAPAEPGDQLRGVTLDQARAVIDEAAKLHASHWENPAVEDLPWVSGTRAAPASQATGDLVGMLWQGFRARYAERLEPAWIEVGERLIARFDRFAAIWTGPRCLTHNDYRPDNMMFATPAGGRAVTVLDWQSLSLGSGAVDVAYFLAGALPPEVRRAHEVELLDRYLAALEAGGVRGYGRETLARDYAPGAFLLFLTAFFASMVVKQTPRGDDMFMQMVGSAVTHITDHDGLARLD